MLQLLVHGGFIHTYTRAYYKIYPCLIEHCVGLVAHIADFRASEIHRTLTTMPAFHGYIYTGAPTAFSAFGISARAA